MGCREGEEKTYTPDEPTAVPVATGTGTTGVAPTGLRGVLATGLRGVLATGYGATGEVLPTGELPSELSTGTGTEGAVPTGTGAVPTG